MRTYTCAGEQFLKAPRRAGRGSPARDHQQSQKLWMDRDFSGDLGQPQHPTLPPSAWRLPSAVPSLHPARSCPLTELSPSDTSGSAAIVSKNSGAAAWGCLCQHCALRILNLFSRVSFQPWKLRSLEIAKMRLESVPPGWVIRDMCANRVFLVLPVINSPVGQVTAKQRCAPVLGLASRTRLREAREQCRMWWCMVHTSHCSACCCVAEHHKK